MCAVYADELLTEEIERVNGRGMGWVSGECMWEGGGWWRGGGGGGGGGWGFWSNLSRGHFKKKSKMCPALIIIIIIIISCIYNAPNDALSANRIHIP